jgi:hypothetical protein
MVFLIFLKNIKIRKIRSRPIQCDKRAQRLLIAQKNITIIMAIYISIIKKSLFYNF